MSHEKNEKFFFSIFGMKEKRERKGNQRKGIFELRALLQIQNN